MEIKLRDIVESREALKRLFSGRARAKEAFHLALIRRKVDPILKSFDETKLEKFKEFGYRDMTQPNSWNFWQEVGTGDEKKREFDHDAFDACDEEVGELLDVMIDIDFEIDLATVDKAKIDPALTPDELAAVWWLIKEFKDSN